MAKDPSQRPDAETVARALVRQRSGPITDSGAGLPSREQADVHSGSDRNGPRKPETVSEMATSPVPTQEVIWHQPSPSPREGALQRKKFPARKVRKSGIAAVALLAIGALVWIIVPGGPGNTYSGISYSGDNYNFFAPQAITVDSGHVWVANLSNSVTELNASNGAWIRTVAGGNYNLDSHRAIAADSTHVWVANTGGNSVTELNASDGMLVQVLSGSRYQFSSPLAIADDGTHIWVANYISSSVTELDASDGTLVQVLSGSRYQFSSPQAIIAVGTDVWVADYGNNSVTRLNAG